MDRDLAIKQIRAALKRRSGTTWSVTGGRGTAWGWITIDVPPARRTFDRNGNPGGHYGHPSEYVRLAELLGLTRPVHFQGESIPASGDYYREFVARAEGHTPEVRGQPYWD